VDNNELRKIIEARSRLIRLYGVLEGKHIQTATVLQKDVAFELEAVIKMIDNFLQGKVEFQ
jgi:hypothetical protein